MRFFSSIDTIVMGRKTYDMIASFGEWPYGSKPTWVCSSDNIHSMPGCNLQVGRTPEAAKEEVQRQNLKHIWLVGGGGLAAAFINAKLLTHMSISLMPILLGGGIKLIGDLPHHTMITLEKQQAYPSGFIQVDYALSYA